MYNTNQRTKDDKFEGPSCFQEARFKQIHVQTDHSLKKQKH